jgi:hypothetical protein
LLSRRGDAYNSAAGLKMDEAHEFHASHFIVVEFPLEVEHALLPSHGVTP